MNRIAVFHVPQSVAFRLPPCRKLTSAASAALLRASSAASDVEPSPVETLPPPSFRGGPPTFLGTGAVPEAGGGADPSGRPGWEKGSDSVLPQQFPMFSMRFWRWE